MTNHANELPIVPDVANISYYLLREAVMAIDPPNRGTIARLALELFVAFSEGLARESAEKAYSIAKTFEACLPSDPKYNALLRQLRDAFEGIDIAYDHNTRNEV